MADLGRRPNPYQLLIAVLWLLLLAGIPITSFPPLAEAIGGVTVSPFSLLPMILLVMLFLIPDLLKGGRLPIVVWPLIGFALMAILTAGLALFLPLVPYKGENVFDRLIHAGATLAVGLAFYLIAIRYPSTDRRIRLSLWGIYIGGLLAMVWGTIQATYFLEGINNIPQDLNELHRIISIRDLVRNRTTGLAFEPSWFGDQLVVLYLPLWSGAVLTGRSLLPWYKGPLSVELGLSIWGGWLLLMTRSRVSITALLFAAGLGVLILAWRVAGWVIAKRTFISNRRRLIASWVMRILLLLAGSAVLFGFAYMLLMRGPQIDSRMQRIVSLPHQLPSIRAEYPYDYAYEVGNRLAIAERLVYWRASLQAFAEHPITGVGLGNAGFLFEQGVPAYGYELTEIRAFLNPGSPNFPNPKNLWVRLLSETGIVGTAFYMAWLIALGLMAWRLARSKVPWESWLATSALITLLVQSIQGFSLDSFALPQIWIMLGLISAVILRRSEAGFKREDEPGVLQSGGERTLLTGMDA